MSAAIETQFVTSLGKVNAVITAIDHVCIYSEKDRPIHYRKRLFDIRLHLYHDGIAWNQARHTPSIDAQDIGKPFLDNNATNHQKTRSPPNSSKHGTPTSTNSPKSSKRLKINDANMTSKHSVQIGTGLSSNSKTLNSLSNMPKRIDTKHNGKETINRKETNVRIRCHQRYRRNPRPHTMS